MSIIPNKLKDYIFDKNYNAELNKFISLKSDSFTDRDFYAFNNEYLRRNTLLEEKELTALDGNSKKIILRKDDFYKGFTYDAWKSLDFPQQYTLLHWLQSSLSSHTPLPTIDLISPYVNSKLNGAYINRSNSLYLNYSQFKSGMDAAHIVIHEMDHHDSYSQPPVNSNVTVGDNQISLKNYIRSKFYKRKLIDIDLKDVQAHEKDDVLFYKNLLAPVIAHSTVTKPEIDFEGFFQQYIQNELYYYSPLEQAALLKEKNHLNFMFANQRLTGKDKNKLEEVNRYADRVLSLERMPILKKLDKKSRNKLLNTTFQVGYYTRNNLTMSPTCDRYLHEKSTLVSELCAEVKKGETEISL